MEIYDLLSKKRDSIIDKCFDLTISTYPEQSRIFLRERKRQFTNPVGYTLYHGIERIIDKIIAQESLENFIPPLEEIIRVRAVQDFIPSEAVGFIFLIKEAIYSLIYKEAKYNELMDLLSRIDSLALLAFDIFMKYREKIYDMKARELRDRTWWILKKYNIISEIDDSILEK
ncbi:MAG: RsbRD N-terminal domain-containing protein [Thermodesulfovibrionaceae bacterium]